MINFQNQMKGREKTSPEWAVTLCLPLKSPTQLIYWAQNSSPMLKEVYLSPLLTAFYLLSLNHFLSLKRNEYQSTLYSLFIHNVDYVFVLDAPFSPLVNLFSALCVLSISISFSLLFIAVIINHSTFVVLGHCCWCDFPSATRFIFQFPTILFISQRTNRWVVRQRPSHSSVVFLWSQQWSFYPRQKQAAQAGRFSSSLVGLK